MNGQPTPGLIMPGQHIRSTEGGKGEIGVTRSWALNLLVLRLLVLASFAWEIWALGPLSLGVIVPVYILLSIIKSDDYQGRRLWPCLSIAMLTVAYYAFFAEALWGDWPTLFGWRPDEQRPFWLWLGFVTPVPVAWTVARLYDFRNSYEVTDKNAPGPIKAREPHGGAVGPDNRYGDNGLPVDESEQLAPQQSQRVVRPVVAKANGNHQEFNADAIATPDGKRQFPVLEVLKFARQLPTIGATYEGSWKSTMSVRQWQGLCSICTAAGILSERLQGSPTEVLVDTPEQAIALIMNLVDQYDSPTPLRSTLSGSNGGGGARKKE